MTTNNGSVGNAVNELPKKWFFCSLSWAAVAVLIAAGCGPSIPAGKVRFEGRVSRRNGEPVGYGGVNFAAAEGTETGTAKLGSDGSFVGILSPGRFNVAVNSSKVAIDIKTGSFGDLEWLVPKKYADVRTSGLSIDVSKGMPPVSIAVPE
jgi:hypothetical protein